MNWDEIEGFDGWSETLADLIVKASTAFENEDVAEKNEALATLRDYIKYSPNDIAGPLDEIALRTVLDIVAKDWREGAVELQSRAAELAKLTKEIDAITAANLEAAEGIRMTRIRAVIDRGTETIRALSELKSELGAADLDPEDIRAVGSKIDTAIKAIQNARTAVENL